MNATQRRKKRIARQAKKRRPTRPLVDMRKVDAWSEAMHERWRKLLRG